MAEGKIAELVDNDEIMAQEGLRQPSAAGRFLGFELVDEVNEVEEAAARPGANDGGGDRDRQVSLAGAGSADEDVLRLASRRAPPASSGTCPSSTGVLAKTKLSNPFSTGNLALLIR